MIRPSILLLILACSSLGATSALAASPKVNICHRSGSKVTFLSIATSAGPAHSAHGDTWPSTWYSDADGDGYGNPALSTSACAAPRGYVANGLDCDDADDEVHPGAAETCDDVDDDCDGVVDDAVSSGHHGHHAHHGRNGHHGHDGHDFDESHDRRGNDEAWAGDNYEAEDEDQDRRTWYADADMDNFGDSAAAVSACAAPAGYVSDGSDCNDGDPAVNPKASESCTPYDDDCDGVVNEGDAIDAATWYADDDADGFGDAATTTTTCDAPLGYVLDLTDCDDVDATINPLAAERCDGQDNDCDGRMDEEDAVDASAWYVDADVDGFGDAADPATRACGAPVGEIDNNADCDDADAGISPVALESCDLADDDCDGVVDEPDATDASTWYADADGDAFGDVLVWALACAGPDGYVGDSADCDDADGTVNPTGEEHCDGVDDNCDGAIDEASAVDAGAWYADFDGDGFGDPGFETLECVVPLGFVAGGSDCDDDSADVHPDAIELCDGADNDCDGMVDDASAEDASVWYADVDGDGAGDPEQGVPACTQPTGYSADGLDCDDQASTVHPAAAEVCGDGLDQTCDGFIDEGCSLPTIATMPLELLGADGTTASVTFPLSQADAERPTLWLQIHDLDFDGEGSIQLNGGAWWELQDAVLPGDVGSTDATVAVTALGEGAGYGGIGGLFGTLKLEVALPPGVLCAGENTLAFRFNHTDGVTSGFRVLAFNLLDADGARLFDTDDFAQENPDDWYGPYDDADSIIEGERLWREADLTEPLNGPIAARCADCHTQDGRDLAYFSYSNNSIIARAMFHELSEEQGELIASYIRSLDVPHPGRPWNPPYQPGPGTDSKPPEEWAAGAGLEWVLDDDEDALDYIFPDGVSADSLEERWINPREIPIAFQMLDWNHWLPSIAPQEGLAELGPDENGDLPLDVFENTLKRSYDGEYGDQNTSLREYFSGATHAERCENGYFYVNWFRTNFQWTRDTFPDLPNTREGQILYSTALWWAVKKFEIHQEFELEGCGPQVYGETGEARSWFDQMFDIAPERLHVNYASVPNYEPERPQLAREYHDSAWWYLQVLQNDGQLLGNCQQPVDWGYLRGRVLQLIRDSGVPDPGRTLVLLTRGMQNSSHGVDPGLGFCQGWAPTANAAIWPLFLDDNQVNWESFGRHNQTELLDAYIRAWVSNNQRFTPTEFWNAGDPFLDYNLADPMYLGDHDIDIVLHYFPESLAEQTQATLVAARQRWVPLSTRQAVADWAVTVFPLIDWQSLVGTDCDGRPAEVGPANFWYFDDDNDGFASATTTYACIPPTDYIAGPTALDCDDRDIATNPAATEVCNGLDDDCDGVVDATGGTAAVDAPEWYPDVDGDGYGDATAPVTTCDAPLGYVASDANWVADCDDTDAALSPAATEVDDGIDNNCDGRIDESPFETPPTWIAAASGTELVLIPAGSFLMGTTLLFAEEQPVHTVELTHDFYVGRAEVTQSEWRVVTGNSPSTHAGCDDCPVESVTWYQMAAFTNILSAAEGFDACYTGAAGSEQPVADMYGCNGYRLLTEAEWEYAAKAGEEWLYSGSDTLGEVAWTSDNTTTTHEVCTLSPNAWGLCDMSGNVWDVVGDWYAADYYSRSPGIDPPGALSTDAGSVTARVIRGGSFRYGESGARVGYRSYQTPTGRGQALGFRIARTIVP